MYMYIYKELYSQNKLKCALSFRTPLVLNHISHID